MLFVFCTCKAHNLVENTTNLAENLKKLGSAEPVEPAFGKSGPLTSMNSLWCILRADN